MHTSLPACTPHAVRCAVTICVSCLSLSGTLDYSFWDKYVQNPDDPVTLAEQKQAEEEKERLENEQFEKQNEEFVKQFKEDMEARKKSQKKKAKEAECS